MLDRTGGTGTGHVAIGGTIEFRFRRKSAATYCTEDMTFWHRRSERVPTVPHVAKTRRDAHRRITRERVP